MSTSSPVRDEYQLTTYRNQAGNLVMIGVLSVVFGMTALAAQAQAAKHPMPHEQFHRFALAGLIVFLVAAVNFLVADILGTVADQRGEVPDSNKKRARFGFLFCLVGILFSVQTYAG